MPELTIKITLELGNETYMRALEYYMHICKTSNIEDFYGEGGFERCLASLLDLALQTPEVL